MEKKLGLPQKQAWVALLLAHGSLLKSIEGKLAEAGVVPMDVYDILISLEESPDHKLKMSQLASCALMTRSGLTRLVDRLEKQGLVRRDLCPSDRRAVYAVLTDKGLAERERAWPPYEAAIQEFFGSKLTNQEAEQMKSVLLRLVSIPHPLLNEDWMKAQ